MDPLMPLQIVVSVETLWTLIALERPIIGSRLLMLWVAHEMRHCCCVTAVETGHHRWVSSDKGESATGVLNVGEDRGLAARVLQGWSLLVLVG
jgi:hypothetical protein